ncbi:hypothetical protein FRC03_011070 [Tulasnella sp. 419]|nr:hypothetical protein FRC02_011875 [Tulasnella sp. 418]KAG8966885.1 hypothetical protein FRC03_011070 [Tulasnella sp. 419]
MSGSIAQDNAWKSKEQGDEARYIREREQAQLAAMREKQSNDAAASGSSSKGSTLPTGDIEGGFGGQEDLEDRYATTSGEH